MAVYYKFKSAKDYDTIAVDGHFISVGALKEKIFESKHLGRGTDFDLVVTNAQTEEEYKESAMIPRNTAVLIRRVPGRRGLPIVATRVTKEPKLESKEEDVQTVKSGFVGSDTPGMKPPEDIEWDVFGNDLYEIPDVPAVQPSIQVQDAPPPSNADEESKIKALIDTPALDWQHQPVDGFGQGRGFVRKMNNRNFVFERKTPPPGYVCHRCKVPGHFIQHCPTNGDPNYDIRKAKPPTGIPKSMLMPTPDGSYALPDGAAGVLKPNEAAFEKEIEGLPSTRSVSDFPPELRCPLCKEVMKDAVLTSKCCFKSFCDKCIRDYIISKSMCVCGATNILADDLLPNKTLRDTISRMLESNTSSAENGGSAYQVQDMESRNPQGKFPSPTQSAASKGGQQPPPLPYAEKSLKFQETTGMGMDVDPSAKMAEKEKLAVVADTLEATHESISVREPASQGSAPLADEEVQQKPASGDAGKKKKKKKPHVPVNSAEMQWRMAQEFAGESYMMSMGPSAYNPYWGMQPGIEGFIPPYAGAMPYMGYGAGPMDAPFRGVMPQDPFGGHGCMLPFGPPLHRDLVDFGMLGYNSGPPPPMSREEFEARKADLKRRREMERRVGESRNLAKEREFGREVNSSADVSSMKLKSKPIPPPASSEQHSYRSERPSPDRRLRDPDLPRPSSKRKADYDGINTNRDRDRYDDRRRDHHDEPRRRAHEDDHHRRDFDGDHQPHRSGGRHRSESASAVKSSSAAPSEPPASKAGSAEAAAAAAAAAMDKKNKASVFSRICFPEGEAAASKKRKQSSSEAPAIGSGSHKKLSNGYNEDHHSKTSKKIAAAASVDYESSDDDRHFKRKPSRYEPSPPPVAAAVEEEHLRHLRGFKDRDRHCSKHR